MDLPVVFLLFFDELLLNFDNYEDFTGNSITLIINSNCENKLNKWIKPHSSLIIKCKLSKNYKWIYNFTTVILLI